MVRFVSCGVRKCRQGAIDRERETETSQTKEKKGRTEYVHGAELLIARVFRCESFLTHGPALLGSIGNVHHDGA